MSLHLSRCHSVGNLMPQHTYVSYLLYCWPLYSVEQNGLCSFVREHCEKHFR